VTDSAMASRSRGRVPSGKRRTAPVNRRGSAWNRLRVTWRRETRPDSAAGPLREGPGRPVRAQVPAARRRPDRGPVRPVDPARAPDGSAIRDGPRPGGRWSRRAARPASAARTSVWRPPAPPCRPNVRRSNDFALGRPGIAGKVGLHPRSTCAAPGGLAMLPITGIQGSGDCGKSAYNEISKTGGASRAGASRSGRALCRTGSGYQQLPNADRTAQGQPVSCDRQLLETDTTGLSTGEQAEFESRVDGAGAWRVADLPTETGTARSPAHAACRNRGLPPGG